jgi:hypothetical protein
MGIFREMSENRETLEENVKSCCRTRRQDQPPDANSRELTLISIKLHFKHHYRSCLEFKIHMHCATDLNGVAKWSQCNPTFGSKDPDTQRPQTIENASGAPLKH